MSWERFSLTRSTVKLSKDLTYPFSCTPFIRNILTGTFSFLASFRNVSCRFIFPSILFLLRNMK